MKEMQAVRRVIECSRCGAEVSGRPVEREGKLYCCEGCAQGSPCLCRQLQAERLLSLK